MKTLLAIICIALTACTLRAEDLQGDFENSWNFYSNRARQGADNKELLSILDRIEAKYAGKGIDLGFVADEKKKLLTLKDAAAQANDNADDFDDRWTQYENSDSPTQDKLQLLDEMQADYSANPEALNKIVAERRRLLAADDSTPEIWSNKQDGASTPEASAADAPKTEPNAIPSRRNTPQPVTNTTSVEPFVQADFWLRGDAHKKDKDMLRPTVEYFHDIGYDSSSGSIEITNGLGARFGCFWPSADGLTKVGGSFGYIRGPKATTTINGYSRRYGNGSATTEDTVDLFRWLVEAKRILPITKDTDLVLRGGAGYARGSMKTKFNASGTFVSILHYKPSTTYSNSWSGFAWELMPSFVIKGAGLNLEFGFGVASFPTMDENDDYYEFKWRPYGMWVGLQF